MTMLPLEKLGKSEKRIVLESLLYEPGLLLLYIYRIHPQLPALMRVMRNKCFSVFFYLFPCLKVCHIYLSTFLQFASHVFSNKDLFSLYRIQTKVLDSHNRVGWMKWVINFNPFSRHITSCAGF